MGIEKDINQQKFRNEYQKSIVNLIYTYNWVTEQIKVVLEASDLTMQQFNILRILRAARHLYLPCRYVSVCWIK